MTKRSDDISRNDPEKYRTELARDEELSQLRTQLLRQRDENNELLRKLETERMSARAHIQERESELDARAEKLRQDFAKREEEQQRRMEQELRQIEDQSVKSQARASAMLDKANHELHAIRREREQLREEMAAFEKEKLRYDEEANDKLQATSSSFVDGVITDLRERETDLMNKSTRWSLYGGLSLFIAFVIASVSIYRTSTGLANEIPISNVIYLIVKGTFFMGIAGIIARFAFVLSKRYLGESLRVSDIIHGVSFGQMYVQSYGATAGWEQVKDAFSQWHDRPSQEAVNESAEPDLIELEGDEKSIKILEDILKAIRNLKE